jgi:hypothetical protein
LPDKSEGDVQSTLARCFLSRTIYLFNVFSRTPALTHSGMGSIGLAF